MYATMNMEFLERTKKEANEAQIESVGIEDAKDDLCYECMGKETVSVDEITEVCLR